LKRQQGKNNEEWKYKINVKVVVFCRHKLIPTVKSNRSYNGSDK